MGLGFRSATAEERDASNNVTKRFYAQGEQIGGTSYFFTTDHLGSIREMTDSTGAIHARYDYDPTAEVPRSPATLRQTLGLRLLPASGQRD